MDVSIDPNDDYTERSQEYLDGLDFAKLEEIKSKDLASLTDADFVALGFFRVRHDEIENLFCCADLNGVKIYIHKKIDGIELLGYRLVKEKDISSTAELLDETITKWRLKM